MTGDHVKKGEVISKLYAADDTRFNPAQNDAKTIEQLVQDAVFAGLHIGPTRRISSDPRYGVEILRNMAVRAISQSDIRVALSCTSGLLRIFYSTAKMKNSSTVPFVTPIGSNTDKHVATINTVEGDLGKETLVQLSNIHHISSISDTCSRVFRKELHNFWQADAR